MSARESRGRRRWFVDVPGAAFARRWLRRDALPWILLALLVVVGDQASKWLASSQLAMGERASVLPFLSWVLWHNDGAAFSLMAGFGGWQRWLFVGLAIGFSAFVLFELRRLRRPDRLQGCALGLLLGGALGNLIDRVSTGYVVDFVLLHYRGWYFPAFNLADTALTLGAALLIFCMLRDWWAARQT